VGSGYRVVMPVAQYFTWMGTNLERHGLLPDVEVAYSPEASWDGRDNQLERAVDVARASELASRFTESAWAH
jgi:C-terminal processing protease CtpA/Prc